MNTIDKPNYTLFAVERFKAGHRQLAYLSIINRNIAKKSLESQGIKVKCTVKHNVRLHPEYVEDYKGMIDTGFGNTMYDTLFPKLYSLEVIL